MTFCVNWNDKEVIFGMVAFDEYLEEKIRQTIEEVNPDECYTTEQIAEKLKDQEIDRWAFYSVDEEEEWG